MTRVRFAQLVRELAEAPPDLLRGALLSLAAAIDPEASASDPGGPKKSKPRRRSRTVVPHPEPGIVIDDLARARARRMVGKV